MDITAKTKFYNSVILDAAQRLGGLKQLAEYLGVTYHTVQQWSRFRPLGKKSLHHVSAKLAELTGNNVAEIFPEWLPLVQSQLTETVEQRREMTRDDMLMFRRREAPLLSLDKSLDAEVMKADLGRALKTLSNTQRRVVEMRYGLGDEDRKTYRQIGSILNLSAERVRQVELRALKKLREPSRHLDRANALAFTDGEYRCSRCRILSGDFRACARCNTTLCWSCFPEGKTICCACCVELIDC